MTERTALRTQDYLDHILTAIGRIEDYMSGLVQDAVIRNVAVIGEVAGKIRATDPAFAQHNATPARPRLSDANALIHGYDAINLATVWNTVQDDLPRLKVAIQAIVQT